jgi:uncharacterized protein YegP (UPF0339 family)
MLQVNITFKRVHMRAGKYRFKLVAANKQIIGTSEGYESETNMKGGIESVTKWAPTAPVKEV